MGGLATPSLSRGGSNTEANNSNNNDPSSNDIRTRLWNKEQ